MVMIKSDSDLRLEKSIQTALGEVVGQKLEPNGQKGWKGSIDALWNMARNCFAAEEVWFSRPQTFRAFLLSSPEVARVDGPVYFYHLFVGDDQKVRLVDTTPPKCGEDALAFVENMRSVGPACAFCKIQELDDTHRYLDRGPDSRGQLMHPMCRYASFNWTRVAHAFENKVEVAS